MRFIFVDEAGTSGRENVTLVVGIIAHADSHLLPAESAYYDLLRESISENVLRMDGFKIHATEIFHGNNKRCNYREIWPRPERMQFIKRVLDIPLKIGMPVCIGCESRSDDVKRDHLAALANCLGCADMYIDEHADKNEVATVVAESLSEGEGMIRRLPSYLRRELKGIKRIRGSIHFVNKNEDPLVDIADFYAFAFRRYFEGQSRGEELINSIFGRSVSLSEKKQILDNGQFIIS